MRETKVMVREKRFTNSVLVRVSDEMLKWLQVRAKGNERTVSDLIREYIREKMKSVD